MTPRVEMLQRCFDYYTSHLESKQSECKKEGYPNLIDEDIKTKIEGLKTMKDVWNSPGENTEMHMKYHDLMSDSLINYRQQLLKSVGLVKGDIQGLKHPFTKTEVELNLIEEARRDFGM